jgi:hypothetical protein
VKKNKQQAARRKSKTEKHFHFKLSPLGFCLSAFSPVFHQLIITLSNYHIIYPLPLFELRLLLSNLTPSCCFPSLAQTTHLPRLPFLNHLPKLFVKNQ